MNRTTRLLTGATAAAAACLAAALVLLPTTAQGRPACEGGCPRGLIFVPLVEAYVAPQTELGGRSFVRYLADHEASRLGTPR